MQDNDNVLPDYAIHAGCTYNIFSNFNNTIYGLGVGRKSISDVLPQVPVEYTNSSIPITTYHLTAILIVVFLQTQSLNVFSCTFTMATESSSLSNVSDFPVLALWPLRSVADNDPSPLGKYISGLNCVWVLCGCCYWPDCNQGLVPIVCNVRDEVGVNIDLHHWWHISDIPNLYGNQEVNYSIIAKSL